MPDVESNVQNKLEAFQLKDFHSISKTNTT